MNQRQLEVLRWIVAGCPDGVEGDLHKTSAIALRNRRLVTVSKKGGIWRAEPTAAGRHFAEQERYPDGHWSQEAKPSNASALRRSKASGTTNVSDEARATTSAKVTGKRPVEQFIDDLVAADGVLVVSARDAHRYQTWIASAERYNKVPEGKLIRIKNGATWGERIVALEDQPEWMKVPLGTVLVAESLRKPHPAVRAIRDDKRLGMKPDVRSRALRFLDALAKEGDRRGHEVIASHVDRRRQTPRAGLLTFIINSHENSIDLDELNDRVPHVPTATEIREADKYSWKRVPDYDHVPSGRLRLRVLGDSSRPSTFSDTKTIDLADRLPEALREIELMAGEDEARRLERERAGVERKRRWEEVREQAKMDLIEHHRREVLATQIERWRTANELDAYIKAMADRLADLDAEERLRAEEWLEWAESYRARLDPTKGSLAMPSSPELTPSALQPFMRGLSPYGPT